MGLYDIILVPCPKCGEEYDFQTKSGPCCLGVFFLAEAPEDVLADVNRHAPAECGRCGNHFYVEKVTRKAVAWSGEKVGSLEERRSESDLADRVVSSQNQIDARRYRTLRKKLVGAKWSEVGYLNGINQVGEEKKYITGEELDETLDYSSVFE